MKTGFGRVPRIRYSLSCVMWPAIARRGATVGASFAAAAVLLLAGGGCATTRTYTPKDLPNSLQAPTFQDPTAVNPDALTPPPGKGDLISPQSAGVAVGKHDLPPVVVTGLVAKPKEVEYPVGRPLRLTNAIALAGGESNDVADSVLIQRRWRVPGGQGAILILRQSRQGPGNDRENLILRRATLSASSGR